MSPSESSLHPEVQQLFAELDEVGTRPWMWVDHQADHVPDAVAISDSDETWTWRHLRQEVHRWSARVAVAAGPEAPAARPGELDAAWITYTSGSTGVPKGMTTTHGMLTQRAAEGRRSVIIPERPVVSGFQELSFMGVVKSVFGGLAAGADVRLFRPRLESVSAILSTIQQERLTFLHGPPQLMRPLWSICGPDDPRLATVRQVRLGADRTQPADLRAALRCLPGGCEVVIAYGSGELGSIAEVHYRRGDTIPAVRVPVGYPEAWVEVMVVDDDGAPVPRGETGAVELRSHGYTALPFPPRPAEGVVRATLRNGDTAQILDDGSLDLVGRADARVKVDGVGVDLNEVDTVLQAHPAVDRAVCVLTERSDRRVEPVTVVPSLLIGAEVRLVHARSTSLASIVATIAGHGVIQLLAPPQMIKAVVGQCQTDDPRLRTVRNVRLSADRTQLADLRAALRCLPPHCVVVSSYGASETGAISENEFRRGDEVPPGRILIGRPRKWIEVHILDEDDVPVPPGEVGVIEVRSRLLMPEPFPRTGVVHHRWIRTGDLARVLPDGSLDLVGRANARVKVDGVPVDLNEVEAAVASHPDIESAVCVRVEDANARAEIVAFVVAARPVDPAELRERANRLAPNARPGRYHHLDRLPVTSRGKVDREALRLGLGSSRRRDH